MKRNKVDGLTNRGWYPVILSLNNNKKKKTSIANIHNNHKTRHDQKERTCNKRAFTIALENLVQQLVGNPSCGYIIFWSQVCSVHGAMACWSSSFCFVLLLWLLTLSRQEDLPFVPFSPCKRCCFPPSTSDATSTCFILPSLLCASTRKTLMMSNDCVPAKWAEIPEIQCIISHYYVKENPEGKSKSHWKTISQILRQDFHVIVSRNRLKSSANIISNWVNSKKTPWFWQGHWSQPTACSASFFESMFLFLVEWCLKSLFFIL